MKKAIKSVFSLALSVCLLLPTTFFSPLTARAADGDILADDFNSYDTGAFTGNAKWTVKTPVSGESVSIVADPDHAGNKFLKITRGSNGGDGVAVYNTSPANANGTFTIDTRIMRTVSTAAEDQYGMYSYNSGTFNASNPPASSGPVATVGMNKSNIVTHTTRNNSATTVAAGYAANVWYHIYEVVNMDAGTFDFYVDGRQILTGKPLRTWSSGLDIDYFSLFASTAAGGDFYVDSFNVYAGQPRSNAFIDSVAVSDGTALTYDAPTHTYTGRASGQSVHLTVKTYDPNVKSIQINGKDAAYNTSSDSIALSPGNTAIPIAVTAADGTTMESYTVVLANPLSNANIQSVTVGDGTALTYNAQTRVYTGAVTDTASVSLTVAAEDSNVSSIRINGQEVGNNAPVSVALARGPNSIPVVVTAADGVTTEDYTVVLTRPQTAQDHTTPTDFYISSTGDDESDGSQAHPWKTIEKINAQTFIPGDRILFGAGGTWSNVTLAPKGSGTESSPITIGSYGEGAKPILAGNAQVSDVISLYNQQHWDIGNLEISNQAAGYTGTTSDANGDLLGDFRGIHIAGQDAGTLSGFHLHDLYIHDVTGWDAWISGLSDTNRTFTHGIAFNTGWDYSKRTGGILIESLEPKTGTPTTFSDVLVENNRFVQNSFAAFTIKQWRGTQLWADRNDSAAAPDYTDANWAPHQNITVKNNYIDQTGDYNGDGIYLTSVQNALVEGNVVKNPGVCGIELYFADHVTVQNNEVYGSRKKAGGGDSNAIDADRESTNIIFQYNYIHNNGDGFLICGFTYNSVILRYNIMKDNTGILFNDIVGSGLIQIYNNIIYNTPAANRTSLVVTNHSGSDVWQFRDNVFYNTSSSVTSSTFDSSSVYDHNSYFGPGVTPPSSDQYAVTADPLFTGTLTDDGGISVDTRVKDFSALKPQAGSPLIDAGVDYVSQPDKLAVTPNGLDYAGYSIVGTTDIGLYEYGASAQVDRTALQAAVDAAEQQNKAAYTSASWTGFEDSLSRAQTVLNAADSTQTQIAQATSDLQSASDALVEVDGVLLNETFAQQTDPANFGIGSGAQVSDGVLNIVNPLANDATSVKTFDTSISGQKKLELSFDWKSLITASSRKGGFELRDSAGNLLFAMEGVAGSLRYAAAGPVRTSSSATAGEPNPTTQFKSVSIDASQWYTVKLSVDFDSKKFSFSIAPRDNPTNRVAYQSDVTTTAGNLASLVTAAYYNPGDGGVAQQLDNMLIRAAGPLAGKTVYALGDSIVEGHQYTTWSFPDAVADAEGMFLSKYALNGATISNVPDAMGGQIIAQVQNAPTAEPDYVLFDGGTNDAECIVEDPDQYSVGTVSAGVDPSQFDLNSYAGSFENTVYAMKQKWPDATIVYVAVHKLVSRDWDTQEKLRAVTLQICQKWGVAIADVFGDSTLDTRDDAQRIAYTFDSLTNGLPGTNGSGTHPNLAGIDQFYLPVVTAKLEQLANVDLSGLYSTVAQAAQKHESEYTPKSWADSSLPASIAAAQAVLDDETTTQDAADTALGSLQGAINLLVLVADKTALASVIDAAEKKVETDYTGASWAGFAGELADAQTVLADVNATQDEVDTAAAALAQTQKALVAKPVVTGVTVTPQTASVGAGKAQKFSAAVTGENAPAQTVTWSVSGNRSGGTIISGDGVLTVASDETAKTLTVMATSTEDTDQSGTASVTVDTLQTLRDEVTGVEVTAPAGVLPDGASLVVTPIHEGETFELARSALADVGAKLAVYNIGLLLNNAEVEPDGSVEVRLPIPDGFDSSRVALYRIGDDGSRTLIGGKVEDGVYVFTTDHFSTYALVEKAAPDSSTPSVSDTGSAGNPQTGSGPQAGFPVSLAVFLTLMGGATVFALKQKNRRK